MLLLHKYVLGKALECSEVYDAVWPTRMRSHLRESGSKGRKKLTNSEGGCLVELLCFDALAVGLGLPVASFLGVVF